MKWVGLENKSAQQQNDDPYEIEYKIKDKWIKMGWGINEI